MKYIYALGLSETGGCWLPNERAYSTFELADAARVKSGSKDLKIFTLVVVE